MCLSRKISSILFIQYSDSEVAPPMQNHQFSWQRQLLMSPAPAQYCLAKSWYQSTQHCMGLGAWSALWCMEDRVILVVTWRVYSAHTYIYIYIYIYIYTHICIGSRLTICIVHPRNFSCYLHVSDTRALYSFWHWGELEGAMGGFHFFL